MNRRAGTLLGLSLLVGVAAAACRPGTDRDSAPPSDPATLAVPDPDLGRMEPGLARWLAEARERVAQEAARPGSDPVKVAQGFGELGELYYLFDLHDAAEVAFDHAVRLEPKRFRWLYLLAVTLRGKGGLAAAASHLERALALEPESLPALLTLGEVQLELGQTSQARRRFEQASALDPTSAAACFGLGRTALVEGDAQRAAELFVRTLDLEPAASVVHYQLAQAYRQLGRSKDAERHLARRGERPVTMPDPIAKELSDLKILTAFRVALVLAEDTSTTPPEQALGFALTHLGSIAGTALRLEEVIATRVAAGAPAATLARLHYVTAGLLVRQRQDLQATDHLRRAVELDGDLFDAWVKLGNALAREGRFADAVAAYDEALVRHPDHRGALEARATAHLNLGQLERARRDLEQILVRHPGDPVAQVRLAELAERSGDLAAAERRYRQALEAATDPRDQARLHAALGGFLTRRGNLREALAALSRAVDLDPVLVSARLRLAALLGHQGRFDEAVHHYAQVIAQTPDHEEARMGEATALILAGRFTDARGRLEEGLVYLPASSGLAELLARLLAAAPEPALRDGDRALELADQAYGRRPDPRLAEILAMAHAERGDFPAAVDWQRRAISGLDAGTATAARQRLALYQRGQAFRAASGEELLGPPGGRVR